LNNKNNSKISVLQQNDNQWLLFPLFGKSPAQSSGHYGLLMNYFKFGEYFGKDASGNRIPTRAFTKFFRSEKATLSDQTVENIKILYRNPTAPFKVSIVQNGKNLSSETLEKTTEMGVYSVDLEGKFENLIVNFEGTTSPEITGIALDSKKGITFDNVPMRGSSGLGFGKINREHLKNQLQKLNVKLLILQFGANLDFKQKDYAWYEEAFYKELKIFKELAPNVSILVIGTSDRSYNNGGDYVSYPSVAMIRDAQRNAAFRADCAFWDLYEVMGGKNSMPSWVFAKDPLAIKDFTHFTQKGANIVSEMLYEALIKEYNFAKPLL
jgi:lysophospholipase L1-like esterase